MFLAGDHDIIRNRIQPAAVMEVPKQHIFSYAVDPDTNYIRVTQFFPMFPSGDPGCLCDLFRYVGRGAASKDEPDCDWIACAVRPPVFLIPKDRCGDHRFVVSLIHGFVMYAIFLRCFQLSQSNCQLKGAPRRVSTVA